MDESLRLRIIGDPSGAISSLNQVEKVAQLTADKITGSFSHIGSLFKRTIGFAGLAVGIDTALESASTLINLQKAQSQIIANQAKQKGSLISLDKFQLEGSAKSYEWSSKYLDNMATQLSLSNAISKNEIVKAQTLSITNTDLLKFYKTGGKYLKDNLTYQENGHDAMQATLQTAANLAEVTHQGVGGSMRILNRIMADPAKRMSSMSRMGIQLSKADQDRIKQVEKQNGLVAAQGALLTALDKTYHNVASSAASPVELLKNDVALIWQSLGQGLIPVVDALANAVVPFVTQLIPVLKNMAVLIRDTAETLGKSLGNLFADLIPLIDLVVKGLLPAFFNLITPLVQMADAIISPFAKAFEVLVGVGTKIGPLSQAFQDMGTTIASNLQPAIDFLTKSFKSMVADGTMTKMMDSLLDAFKGLAPILPQLALSFAQLVIAISPAFIAALPDIVKSFNLFTKILVVLTPLLTTVIGGLTKLVSFFTGNKGLTGVIGALLAIWFTKSLFLTPVMAAASGIGMLMGKLVSLGSATKTTGGLFKSFFSGGKGNRFGNMVEYGAGRLEKNVAILRNKAGAASAAYGEGSSKHKKLLAQVEAAEARASLARGRQGAVARLGGGFMGAVRAFSGFGLGNAFQPTNQMDATKQNTAALIDLTTALKMGAGGTLSGGYGGFGGRASGYEALHRNLSRTPNSAHNPYMQGLEALRSNLAAKEAEQAVAKSGILGRITGRLGGGIFGKMGGMLGGIRGKVGGMGMVGKGLMGGAAGLATVAAGPLLTKILPKSVSGVANAALGGASMGMMFGPWGAAIGAAIGAITNLFHTCKPFHDFVVKIGKTLKEWGMIIWKHVAPALKAIWKVLQPIAKIYIKAIITEFKILWGIIKFVWGILMDVGKFIWNVLVKYVKMYVQAWKDVYNAVMWVWHGIVNGGKIVWGWLKSAFNFLSNAGKWVWANLYNGFVTVANMIISAWNDTLGGIMGAVGINVKVTKLTAMKVPKFHSGGIVPGSPGKEVPAILQAGETVLSMSQTRARANAGGGGQLAVHPGAVVININGSADERVTAQIKSHVEGQFKELHRTLKGMGR